MTIGDIFKYRNTEPAIIVTLRVFTLCVSFIALIAYFITLIFSIANDRPLLQISSYLANEIPMPDVVFSSVANFSVTCQFWNNHAKIDPLDEPDKDGLTNCDQYISPMTFDDYFGGWYMIPFVPNSSLYQLARFNKRGFIVFNLFTPNTTIDQCMMNIFDRENNPFRVGDDIDPSISNGIQRGESITLSEYRIGRNQMITILFSRKIKKVLKQTLWNLIGIIPKRIDKPNIVSSYSSLQTNENITTRPGYFATILVGCSDFRIQVESEQSARTLFSIFATIGGFWNLADRIYAFLFGTAQLSPWGVIHYYACCLSTMIKRSLRDSLVIIPLMESREQPLATSFEDLAEQVRQMRAENESLKVFLRDYIIDASYLQKVNNEFQ